MSTTITGNESFWGSVKLSAGALALINKSPTLVNQLQQYGNAVADHTTSPMQIGTGNGTFYDSASNQVVFAGNYQNWTDSITVGNLAHEIGHYVNSANDRAFAIQHQTALGDPNAYSMDAMIGLHREGEAVDNNYIVQQEIKQNGGGLVYGGTGSGRRKHYGSAIVAGYAAFGGCQGGLQRVNRPTVYDRTGNGSLFDALHQQHTTELLRLLR